MTNYVLDTSIVSEIFQRENLNVLDWLADTSAEQLFLPMPAVGELARYPAKEGLRDEEISSRTEDLSRIYSRFALLEADRRVFLRWGVITANVRGGRSRLAIDALIAATGLVHDMVVATTNTGDFKHFTSFGVRLYDPSEYQRPDPP